MEIYVKCGIIRSTTRKLIVQSPYFIINKGRNKGGMQYMMDQARFYLRTLGITSELAGIKILEGFIQNEIKPEDLTQEQRQLVLEAWEGRIYVPVNKKKFVDKVRPDKNLDEHSEAYEKEYVELIYKYLQTLM